MKVCFVTNHYKTFFFLAVAKRLEQWDVECVWVSTSRRWTDWLLREGVSPEDICDISTRGERWTSSPPSVLGELPEMQVGALILADRYLRTRPVHDAEAYLTMSWQLVREFLLKHSVDVALGEATYGIECLIAQLAPGVGVKYLVPHTVRHPADRFTLFQGWRQAKFASSHAPSSEDVTLAAQFVQEYSLRPEQPKYFHANQGRLKPRISWLGAPWRQHKLSRTDPYEWTRPTLSRIVRDHVSRIWNGQLIRKFPFVTLESVLQRGRPYVLLTLHRQPEASLDVLGYQFSSQVDLVRRLAQEIPSPHMLVVKEHSNGLGDRGWRFYRDIRKFPNVVLVDPFTSSLELMQNAAITLSVSGTSAYEAALQGLPAATFADMFFTEITLPGAPLRLEDGQLSSLLDVGRRANLPKRIDFVARLLANSRPGVIGSPFDTPGCMSSENVSLVAEGLMFLLGTPTEGRK